MITATQCPPYSTARPAFQVSPEKAEWAATKIAEAAEKISQANKPTSPQVEETPKKGFPEQSDTDFHNALKATLDSGKFNEAIDQLTERHPQLKKAPPPNIFKGSSAPYVSVWNQLNLGE